MSAMSLHMIVGPMKSGKSLELIARISPYEYTNKKLVFVQSTRNSRDSEVQSRLGVSVKAKKITSLQNFNEAFDVIGIDEIHMFSPDDIEIIKQWLEQGKSIYVSGLDLDYQPKMIPIIQQLYELQPESITHKKAVCDTCGSFSARYTTIFTSDGKQVRSGLPPVVPEDGTYTYKASCRNCHFKPAIE